MNNFFKKMEVYMVAASFAEANQHGTAIGELSRFEMKRKRKQIQKRVDAPRPRPELRAPSRDE